jgi:class 3 adenylate cyclase
MRQAIPVVVFSAVLVLAVAFGWWRVRDAAPAPSGEVSNVADPDWKITGRLAEHPAEMTTDALWEAAAAQADCRLALDLWWELAMRRPDEVEPWRAIAECGRGGGGLEHVVDEAAHAFEQSRVLGLFPLALDAMSVRGVVPILNRVDPDQNQASIAMYRLGRQLRDAGDPVGAAEAFRKAVSLDPDDSETNLAYGYSLVQTGDLDGARSVLRRALAKEGFQPRLDRLYAFGVVWPEPFLGVVIALVGLAVTLYTRTRDASPPWALLAALTFTGVALGAYFSFSGDQVAFLMLATCGGLAAAWLVVEPVRRVIVRTVGAGLQVAADAVGGALYRSLVALPTWVTGGVLAVAVLALLFGVPFVSNMDARLGLLLALGFVMLSATGALISPWLERVRSLRVALAGLGAAGTLPFLFFLLFIEREALLRVALDRRWLQHDDVNRLAAALMVWALGLVASLVLARLLAYGLIEPIERISAAVARVRSGDAAARAGLERADEIGQLGAAVDAMAGQIAGHREAEQLVRRFVHPRLAERLASGDTSVFRGRRVVGTVLVATVQAVGDGDAGVAVDLLNEAFGRVAPVVARHGGTVDRIAGDGWIASWGAHGDPDRPASAVRCAVEVGEAIAALNDELAMRGRAPVRVASAVERGELLCGPVGGPDYQEYAVFGDVVEGARRALRVEVAARVGPSARTAVAAEFSWLPEDASGFAALAPAAG